MNLSVRGSPHSVDMLGLEPSSTNHSSRNSKLIGNKDLVTLVNLHGTVEFTGGIRGWWWPTVAQDDHPSLFCGQMLLCYLLWRYHCSLQNEIKAVIRQMSTSPG